ncbi:MAG: hypothetical protein PWP34_591 [Desulfuromonadales bacterium]|nr:hypothetical protein [Desulfuromonadales bacterium]
MSGIGFQDKNRRNPGDGHSDIIMRQTRTFPCTKKINHLHKRGTTSTAGSGLQGGTFLEKRRAYPDEN